MFSALSSFSDGPRAEWYFGSISVSTVQTIDDKFRPRHERQISFQVMRRLLCTTYAIMCGTRSLLEESVCAHVQMYYILLQSHNAQNVSKIN